MWRRKISQAGDRTLTIRVYFLYTSLILTATARSSAIFPNFAMRTASLALAISCVLVTGACTRKVVVTTPASQAPVSLKVTNTASQAVTVQVIYGGVDFTVGTVAANTTAVLAVAQVASGSTVQLRATLADGSRSYSRDQVVLSGSFEWRVP